MRNLESDIQRIKKKYSGLKFSSKDDARDFVNIHNILESVFGEVKPDILFEAYFKRSSFGELTSSADYYYLVAKTVISNSALKKQAYHAGNYSMPIEQMDLDLWVSMVHRIHKAVDLGHMTFSKAVDYYASLLDDEHNQRERFKQWVRYYADNQHEKYSSGENKMKKDANFQLGLVSDLYSKTPSGPDERIKKQIQDVKMERKERESFAAWKSKINGAIRRIDKLLREDKHLTPEEQSDLADMLHAFDLQMRRIRMRSTASDYSYQASERFKKIGYSQVAEQFFKLAQDLEPTPQEVAPEAPESPPVQNEGPAAPTEPPKEEGATGAIGRALTKREEAVGLSTFDELIQTGGRIDLASAAGKLEEVAARLADRRTIRQLAEFDIMLDKLGIASLFPELAEAQSKLIDAYSYALVRVTKMLGMLSSGRSMAELSDAKKTDISNKAIKEVNKTLTQGEIPVVPGKGTEELNKEFGEGEAPSPEPTQPQPQV